MMFYMFNSINAQSQVMTVTETSNLSMSVLRRVLSYTSVLVSVVLALLITYANKFFIKRRKKEFGIYTLLGMSKRKISSILVLETFFVGFWALILGVFAGVIGSQFMSILTAKMFEADMTNYKFIVSYSAMFKSAFSFGLIFIIVVFINVFEIKKSKLIDLLNNHKKNETLSIRNSKLSFILMIVSFIFIGLAYLLIIENGIIHMNWKFSVSIILGVIGTILFFFSCSNFIVRFLMGKEKFYYKGLNAFLVRQFNTQINTNFLSISVVCLVLFVTIGTFSSGFSVQSTMSKLMRETAPYDISLIAFDLDEKTNLDLPSQYKNFDGIKKQFEIEISQNINEHENDINYSTIKEINNTIEFLDISYMRTSDFNEVLKTYGQEEIKLSDNEYYIYNRNGSVTDLVSKMLENKTRLIMNNTEMLPVGSSEVNISNGFLQFLIIVNDHYVDELRVEEKIINVQFDNPETAKVYEKELETLLRNNESDFISYYYTKREMNQLMVTTKVIVAFLSLYLSLVFLVVASAILAIQQLTNVSDNKQRYELLSKLGVGKRALNKVLFKQILIYFLAPLILAVIHSVVGLGEATKVIKSFGKMNVTGYIFATIIVFIVIYMGYFLLTFFSCKKIIEK